MQGININTFVCILLSVSLLKKKNCQLHGIWIILTNVFMSPSTLQIIQTIFNFINNSHLYISKAPIKKIS